MSSQHAYANLLCPSEAIVTEEETPPKWVIVNGNPVPYQPHFRICPAQGCLRVLNKNWSYCAYHTVWGPGESDMVFD